jgi:hypothetical protein
MCDGGAHYSATGTSIVCVYCWIVNIVKTVVSVCLDILRLLKDPAT